MNEIKAKREEEEEETTKKKRRRGRNKDRKEEKGKKKKGKQIRTEGRKLLKKKWHFVRGHNSVTAMHTNVRYWQFKTDEIRMEVQAIGLQVT